MFLKLCDHELRINLAVLVIAANNQRFSVHSVRLPFARVNFRQGEISMMRIFARTKFPQSKISLNVRMRNLAKMTAKFHFLIQRKLEGASTEFRWKLSLNFRENKGRNSSSLSFLLHITIITKTRTQITFL